MIKVKHHHQEVLQVLQVLRRSLGLKVHEYPGTRHCTYLKINKIEKRLVLIILVIVFKHNINIKKYMFV